MSACWVAFCEAPALEGTIWCNEHRDESAEQIAARIERMRLERKN